MKFAIYYMRPEYFLKGTLGEKPNPKKLDVTHIFLKDLELEPGISRERDLERVYARMQAEAYSPNGEARPLIESKELRHTSMSVGDVIIDSEGGIYLVAFSGFTTLIESTTAKKPLTRRE